MIDNEADEVIEERLKHFFSRMKLGRKHQRKVAISILILSINYIANSINKFQKRLNKYKFS